MPDMIVRPYAWSTEHPTPPHHSGIGTVNMNTSRDKLRDDKGYRIDQQIATETDKGAASFVHRQINGKEQVIYALDTALYDQVVSTIGTAIPEMFGPSFVNMAEPCGFSALLTGDETKTQIIREDGAAGVEAVLLEMGVPAIASSISGSASSWGAGTYQIRVCWIDKDAFTVNVFSHPSVVSTETVTGTAEDIVVNEPGSAPARATHFRVAFTAAGATDTPSNYLYYTDFAVTTGNQTFTAPPAVATTQAFTDINGTYRQAEMALDSVDIGILHEGRMFYAATTNNDVGWSERDNLNHFYSDQLLSNGGETGWNSPVVGMASAEGGIYAFTATSIHRIYGDFTRDDQGASPSYIINVGTEVVDENIGCVSHASIRVVAGITYFFSTRGPAAISGGRVVLLQQNRIRDFLDCHFDWTYASRVVCAEDPVLNMICWTVPRNANTSRVMDGAAVVGICDHIIRWDTVHRLWSPPLDLAAVHIQTRTNGAPDAASKQTFLMAMGQHGAVLQLNYGRSGGGPADVSGAAFDAQVAASQTTLTVTVGGMAAVVGETIVLTYPSTDDNYPAVKVRRTVSSVSGTTATWTGALTVPSDAASWTVHRAGMLNVAAVSIDPREMVDVPPDRKFQLQKVTVRYDDVIGMEAVA